MVQKRDSRPLIPAIYLIFRRGGEVLLLQREGTGYRDGFYSLPAGHVEEGEYPLAACVREAKEEVGVTIDAEDLRFVKVVYRIADEQDHERVDLFYIVEKWDGEPENCEPEKCAELRWAALADLPDKVVPVVRAVLTSLETPGYLELVHD